MKRIITLLFALAALAATVAAQASPIVYTGTVAMTGSMGGTPFTGASLTFTTTADTDNISFISGLYVNTGITTVQSTAFGTTTLSGGTYGAFSGDGAAIGGGGFTLTGFLNLTGGPFFMTGESLSPPYDLSTSYSVTSTNAEPFMGYPRTFSTTDLGNLIISSTTGNATFTAVSTPEPSTYALLCLSLGVVGYARKRMNKAA